MALPRSPRSFLDSLSLHFQPAFLESLFLMRGPVRGCITFKCCRFPLALPTLSSSSPVASLSPSMLHERHLGQSGRKAIRNNNQGTIVSARGDGGKISISPRSYCGETRVSRTGLTNLAVWVWARTRACTRASANVACGHVM